MSLQSGVGVLVTVGAGVKFMPIV